MERARRPQRPDGCDPRGSPESSPHGGLRLHPRACGPRVRTADSQWDFEGEKRGERREWQILRSNAYYTAGPLQPVNVQRGPGLAVGASPRPRKGLRPSASLYAGPRHSPSAPGAEVKRQETLEGDHAPPFLSGVGFTVPSRGRAGPAEPPPPRVGSGPGSCRGGAAGGYVSPARSRCLLPVGLRTVRPRSPAATAGCVARAAGHGLAAAVRGRGAGVRPVAPPRSHSPPSEKAGAARIPLWLRQRLPCPAWLRGGGSDPRCPLHFGAGGGWSQPQGRKRPNKPPSSPKSRIDQRDVRRAPPEGWLPAQGRGAPAPSCPLQSRGSAWHEWCRGPEKRPQIRDVRPPLHATRTPPATLSAPAGEGGLQTCKCRRPRSTTEHY
ncbi:basic salivary proline-rich protein 1-like [Corvus kubaryi]|uniref:basic salivary proline-rich protein 1-like n=1 Tax=Corvus kubaryi TaxID=68294 RepID=UPI001C059EBC|nr:basic salivary proline-rich protein 1-like [Corvus kubaryi]